MLELLGLIPGVLSLISKYTTAKFDAQVAITQAKVGGDKDVATKLVAAAAASEHETTSRLSILASNPMLVFLLIGFALPLVLYSWKIVVVDIIIGPGSINVFWIWHLSWTGTTDPIRGEVADWAKTIIGCLFGSTTVLAAGKMYFGRDKS
jgi:hypothetical protein